MPTPCVIRFTDDGDQRHAHVRRRDHGYPEEVITNLSTLKITVDRYRERPTPGDVGAQFVFLDTLWYALREVPIVDLEEELLTVLYSPTRPETKGADSYLRQHAFLDSTTSVEVVSFLHEVELDESKLKVRTGHNSELFDGPIAEVFQLVSWGFSGELSEALSRFQ